MAKEHFVDVVHFDNSSVESATSSRFLVRKANKVVRKYVVTDYLFKPRNSWWTCGITLEEQGLDQYDLVIVLRFDLGFFIPQILAKANRGKIVFYPIDLVSRLYKSLAVEHSNPLKKIYYIYQSKLIALWENHWFSKVNDIVFVSHVDAVMAKKKFGEAKNFVGIRNGIDVYKSRFKIRESGFNPVITFSGDYSYRPNALAALFIVNEIANSFRQINFPVELRLVGRNSHHIKNLPESDDVVTFVVTGEVEDVRLEIEKADIYCCPLFAGAGMKNKVLQAMSIGIPIISSQLGVDGIEELSHDDNFVLCESRSGDIWRDSIIDLFENIEKRTIFHKHTSDIITKRYTWDSVVKDLLSSIGG
jgi:glycosyltransferase involved in cell wall biosynthesis